MNLLTTSKVLSYLAFIFVAGGATGAIITRMSTQQREAQPPSMEKACHRLQDRLVSTLALTPNQVKQLQPVFDQTTQQLRDVHARAIRESDDILRKAHGQIAPSLTLEQREKLAAFDRERCEWLRRRLKDRGRAVGPDADQPKPE